MITSYDLKYDIVGRHPYMTVSFLSLWVVCVWGAR